MGDHADDLEYDEFRRTAVYTKEFTKTKRPTRATIQVVSEDPGGKEVFLYNNLDAMLIDHKYLTSLFAEGVFEGSIKIIDSDLPVHITVTISNLEKS